MVRSRFVIYCIAILSCTSAWAQTTTRVSVDSNGAQGDSNSYSRSISADGRFVAFWGGSANLVSGDTNNSPDVFVHDRQAGTTTRVSVDSAGLQGNGGSYAPSISADGRYVAFESTTTNLVPGDTNGTRDVFVHDCQTGATTRVSVDSAGQQGLGGDSEGATISADGHYVAFQSSASNLVLGGTYANRDIFVHDCQSGVTTRVSVDSAGVPGNGFCTGASISADGRYVAFDSAATNLVPGDTNGTYDIFVHDRQTGATTRVNVDSAGLQANSQSSSPSISADGRFVAFSSLANNLVPGDTNGTVDVFVHDRQSGVTTRVNVDSAGLQGNGGTSYAPSYASISADGRYVAFENTASNLVPGDTNGTIDVFVHDCQTGATTRVSVDSGGAQGDSHSYYPAISADGRYVTFLSYARNLVPGDTNGTYDVFVRDRGAASAFTPFCFGDGTGTACPCANNGGADHGCENSAATGGALLSATGTASLSADTVQLSSVGELPTALSIVLQGSSVIPLVSFGDGLRCAGGALKRLYVKGAIGGTTSAPQAGDPSITARSATLGDTLPLGATRIYQVYYRDSNLGFCPGGFNVTNAMLISWGS